jgi:hypothetical protein
MSKRRRNFFIDLGLIALLGLLVVGVNKGYLHRHSVKASNIVAPASVLHPALALKAEPVAVAAAGSAMAPTAFRPLNYALLRGGFTSVDEFLERSKEDPILHSFYGDCADRNASLHPLPEDIMVFTSFRKGNQIKWAQKPLLVHKGEYVMTFCGKTVLARCGNLVSMSPMQPSEDIPPALLEEPTDKIEPPLSYAAADPVTTQIAAVPAAAVAHSHFFFIPPFYIPPSHSNNPAPPTFTTVPPPPSHITGDEFSGHQALFTLFLGLLAIGVMKLVLR